MNLPKYMPALDGLRGVAILMVLLTHVAEGGPTVSKIFPGDHDLAPGFTIPDWVFAITASANHGVTLFFVVSAFTLTCRSARDHGDLRGYARRRIARVGPGYWLLGLVYMLFTGSVSRPTAPGGISLLDVAIAAIFGGAWVGGASLAVVPGGWSISCEMSFYIALPMLVRLINGNLWRSFALTGLPSVIALIFARHAMTVGTAEFDAYVNPIDQAPVFLCGVTAALTAMRFKLPQLRGIAITLIVIAIAVLPFQPIPRWHLPPHMLFAAVVAVAVAVAAVHPPWLLASRFMRQIGTVSYSMYLVHVGLLAPSASGWRGLCYRR